MAEANAKVTKRRRISKIWLIPLVAVVVGVWMVVHHWRIQGPQITITFASGEGIEADKTKIKLRDVELGHVESVRLAEDFQHVVVTSRLEKFASPLLRDDTQFWVVRPRVGPGGVSGLGTLLSGGYIQLSPGNSEKRRRDFFGLEEPPVTPWGVPGMRVKLVSERAGSIGAGDPILYKGFRVGRIDSADFDVDTQSMHYGAFVEAPYDRLVTTSTRFWRSSGVSVTVNMDGISLSTGSLETILIGGVTFGQPASIEPGEAAVAGAVFDLYPNEAAVNERPYKHAVEYVVRFSRSVRGLKPNASVEFRGIPVGRVERILIDQLEVLTNSSEGLSIPVLIRVEPGMIGLPDTEVGAAEMAKAVTNAVRHGMRATLATGSLLTGSLYVSLSMYPDEPVAEVANFWDYPTIPTTGGGLEAIENRVVTLLDKVNAMPLEELIEAIDGAMTSVNALLDGPAMRNLPKSVESTLADLRTALTGVSADSPLQERLVRTLTELDRTLGTLRNVLETIDEKPNSLIFSREPAKDPEPKVGSQ
jgi:paraquat-inducible protein B